MALLLLLVVVFAGLVAAQLAPNEAIKKDRSDEELLRLRLSQLRAASDVMLRINPGWSPQSASEAIASLVQFGLYRTSNPTDPTIPVHLWNTGSNSWMLSGNLATRTSFESLDADASTSFIASWSPGTPDTTAATDAAFFPTRDSSTFDDYPGQNLLGEVLGTSGASLRIDR